MSLVLAGLSEVPIPEEVAISGGSMLPNSLELSLAPSLIVVSFVAAVPIKCVLAVGLV